MFSLSTARVGHRDDVSSVTVFEGNTVQCSSVRG